LGRKRKTKRGLVNEVYEHQSGWKSVAGGPLAMRKFGGFRIWGDRGVFGWETSGLIEPRRNTVQKKGSRMTCIFPSSKKGGGIHLKRLKEGSGNDLVELKGGIAPVKKREDREDRKGIDPGNAYVEERTGREKKKSLSETMLSEVFPWESKGCLKSE